MKIILTPEDLVKRCIWDSYVYYVLGSEKEGRELLLKNEEMEITERDALVIGLLKVIETENLIHKFNTYITELLTNKSIREDELMIRKKTLNAAIDKFSNKFPQYWETSDRWENSLRELTNYIEGIKSEIGKLEICVIEDKDIITELYLTNSIKKLLKFNY